MLPFVSIKASRCSQPAPLDLSTHWGCCWVGFVTCDMLARGCDGMQAGKLYCDHTKGCNDADHSSSHRLQLLLALLLLVAMAAWLAACCCLLPPPPPPRCCSHVAPYHTVLHRCRAGFSFVGRLKSTLRNNVNVAQASSNNMPGFNLNDYAGIYRSSRDKCAPACGDCA